MADTPRTIWRKSGRNTDPATITEPNSTPMTMDTEKMSFLNIRSGSSGSSARLSWSRNSAPMTTPALKRPTIIGDVHAYSAPPHVAPRRRLVTETVNRAEPRKSIGRRSAGSGTRRYFAVTSRATRPMGMLT